jgi:hypothetical protein
MHSDAGYKVLNQRSRSFGVMMILLTGILFWGCAQPLQPSGPTQEPAKILRPVTLENLQPGLEAVYFRQKFAHIDDMPTGKYALEIGRPGPPILFINHRFGTSGVFDSGQGTLIGVSMSGFLHFSEPGEYQFKIKSNDGVRIWIGNLVVLDDPETHADRFKTSEMIKIPAEGWFPFRLKYFQKKGSATLELYWRLPDHNDFAIVPAEAYGHGSPQP